MPQCICVHEAARPVLDMLLLSHVSLPKPFPSSPVLNTLSSTGTFRILQDSKWDPPVRFTAGNLQPIRRHREVIHTLAHFRYFLYYHPCCLSHQLPTETCCRSGELDSQYLLQQAWQSPLSGCAAAERGWQGGRGGLFNYIWLKVRYAFQSSLLSTSQS